jgi:hypothetical protein
VGEGDLRRHPSAASAFEAETARFIIPNTSLSVIRVVCVAANGWEGHGRDQVQLETIEPDQAVSARLSISTADLEQLNWMGHLKEARDACNGEETNNTSYWVA